MNYAAWAERNLDVRSRSGLEWMALCPFHDDTSPSFAINVSLGVFVCYACGEKGRVDSAFGTTVKRETNIDDVKSKINGLRAAPPVQKDWGAWVGHWAKCHVDQWSQRGINDVNVLHNFELGFDVINNALSIPVHHPASRRVVSVIKRAIAPEPGELRYRYERGFKISQHLFGSIQVRELSPRWCVITEGSIDALAMWQVGIPAVALLGARVSTDQGKLLRAVDPFGFVVMTDNDRAGKQAAAEIQNALDGASPRCVLTPWWPDGRKDPGDMTEAERRETFFRAVPN